MLSSSYIALVIVAWSGQHGDEMKGGEKNHKQFSPYVMKLEYFCLKPRDCPNCDHRTNGHSEGGGGVLTSCLN